MLRENQTRLYDGETSERRRWLSPAAQLERYTPGERCVPHVSSQG